MLRRWTRRRRGGYPRRHAAMGTLLAVDYGRRRIGLAGTDPLGLAAHPLPPLVVGPGDDAVEPIARLCAERDCERILVGLPLHADGRESDMAAEVRAFGERLRSATDLPVEYVDERWTSIAAREALRDAPKKARRESGRVDSVAALLLLQEWLARGGGGGPQNRAT